MHPRRRLDRQACQPRAQFRQLLMPIAECSQICAASAFVSNSATIACVEKKIQLLEQNADHVRGQ